MITTVDDKDVEWWECFEPNWYPTTKMIKSGIPPPWDNPWKDYKSEDKTEKKKRKKKKGKSTSK